MKSKQQAFFSTRSDLIEMMSIVEKRIPIDYVLMGTFESEVIKRENTISKFSQLGYTRYRNWISLDNRYMVVPLNENVKCRTVVQRNGLCHYIIDLSSNPTGVELSTGGIYENAENVLIAGRIAVFTDFSRNAIQNYNEILKAMKECFINPKHAGRPKKPYTEKAQSKAIRVIGSIADQVKTINDFIREHPYEEDRVKFLLSSVIEQLK